MSHDNVGGYCPSCHALPQLAKQKLKDFLSSGFCTEVCRECENCGREVSGKLICLSDETPSCWDLKNAFCRTIMTVLRRAAFQFEGIRPLRMVNE